MAFGNSQNEKRSTVKDVNTRGLQFYNSSSPVGSGTLITGFWKQTMTVRICPLLPENKRSGSAVYDYDTFISVALTLEKIYALSRGLENIKNKIECGDYDFTSIGTPSGTNYLEITSAKNIGFLEDGIAVILYSDIDENGKAAQKLSFLLNKESYYLNYSQDDGSYEKSEPIEVQFELLLKQMYSAMDALNNAHAHSIRTANQFKDHYINSGIAALKEKLGIEDNKYGGNRSTSYFNTSNQRRNEDDKPLPDSAITDGGFINGGRLDV